MRSRKADAIVFGFDFQINAAIVLMLEHIKELYSLRLEGNDEDIELTLQDHTKIFAQAKAVVNSSFDFTHVRANLKKALISLSEGSRQPNVRQLIFITNSPNPFKDEASRSVFYAPTHRAFSDLPPSAQKIVEDYLSNIENPLDPQKFMVQVLPFETDDETERYKAVMQVIHDFIGELNTSTSPGLGKRLFQVWRNDIFTNGSTKDAAIQLDKKSIIWPIIVIETDITRTDNRFLESLDSGLYDEVVRLYQETIDSCCERIEFFTKVLFDFSHFSSHKSPAEICTDFVENTWETYKDEFDVMGMEPKIQEALTKTVLYNILRRRILIDRVKTGGESLIFQSIRIKEGLYERTFRFTKGVNLIFSKENSRGKTTLLRFMLYSLGYSIPNTRNIQFDRCEVETHLLCEKAGVVCLTRLSKDYIEVVIQKEKTTFILPDQLHELHIILFGTENTDILNNLLGAIYADQEKGWTLLNRGTAIGSIRFNIEELIRGLSGCDCTDLIRRENQISKELGKYRQMFSIAKYRESVIEESGTLVVDDYSVESDAALAQLRIRQKALQHELKRIDKALTDNKRFNRFIAEMKLVIQGPDG